MKNIFIKKTIAAVLTAVTLLGVLPMASSAATKTGWVLKNKDWYYVTTNGSYQTGWMKDSNGVWYYVDGDGVMQKDTSVTTNGHKYKLG